MNTKNYKKFKGEIENYVSNRNNILESRIDRAFSVLNFKTILSRTNIKKKDGYHAAHLLFILTLLPLFNIDTLHGFCLKQWHHWSMSKKDGFYRFKQANYRWRTFMYKVNGKISSALRFSQYDLDDRYFVIDDTVIAKRGRDIENGLPSFPPISGCMHPLSSKSTPSVGPWKYASKKPNSFWVLAKTRVMTSTHRSLPQRSVS